jgi:hypothetical protein
LKTFFPDGAQIDDLARFPRALSGRASDRIKAREAAGSLSMV